MKVLEDFEKCYPIQLGENGEPTPEWIEGALKFFTKENQKELRQIKADYF